MEVWVKRDDLTHPEISGNKFRKLKYNLIQAKGLNKNTLISFGGAYSNHIYALATAAKLFGFQSEGIIRGDELTENSSPTLRFAADCGMKLHFVSRSAYRDKASLEKIFSTEDSYFLPEGGSNELALIGCSEMVDEVYEKVKPTHFCLAAGTGGTTAGVLSNSQLAAQVLCFPVLKNGGFLKEEIQRLLRFSPHNLHLFEGYHFGGYGKFNEELIKFMKVFETQFQIQLEQVYTAKLFFGVFDLIKKNHLPFGSKIVLYHSGGLQGRLMEA